MLRYFAGGDQLWMATLRHNLTAPGQEHDVRSSTRLGGLLQPRDLCNRADAELPIGVLLLDSRHVAWNSRFKGSHSH